MRELMRLWVATTVACLATMLIAQSLQAQKYQEKVLHAFSGTDGSRPSAGVIRDAKGDLYGTTLGGGNQSCSFQGTTGCGVVFKLSAVGRFNVLHAFKGGSNDGGNPFAGVIQDAEGNLYGTTYQGGGAACGGTGCGVMFKLDARGKETVLYKFKGGNDGAEPNGVIRDTKGNLYGTTFGGGVDGWGTVFKLNKSRSLTVLHSFTKGNDGAQPTAAVIQDGKGNLYGTTYDGGIFGHGTVFKVDTSYKETVLHSFNGTSDGGELDAGLLMDKAGNLYGTTALGGSGPCSLGGVRVGCGIVFKIDTAGTFSVLHNFNGPDGSASFAGLIQDAKGNFYGTTSSGGGATDSGLVFKLTSSGKETVLYKFKGTSDGSSPFAGLIQDAAGNLYGTTWDGGDLSCGPNGGGCGVVFKLTP